MGVTVTCGKSAAVMSKANGEQVFALFEKTYEGNVYPHTPEWSCIAFGDYATVIKKVFSYATSCAGGMLQGNGGRWILPENYIAAWNRELAAPGLMENFSISLIDTKNPHTVYATLKNLGRNDLAEKLMRCEVINLQLYEDIEIVLSIYGTDKIESSWRKIRHNPNYFITQKEIGLKRRNGKINPPSVQVMAFDEYKPEDRQCRMVKYGDDPWLNVGWEYRAIQGYIMNVALPCELIETGSSKALISDFREQCRLAEDVPDDAEIRFARCEVDEAKGIKKWHLEYFDKLAYQLGCGQEPIAPQAFSRKWSDVRDNAEALLAFGYLNRWQYEWQIAASKKSSFTTQINLIAA